jgi:hypothetical protein
MATQPLLADGLIRYAYTAAGVPHKLNIRVKLRRASVIVGSMPDFVRSTDPGSSIDADAFTLLLLPHLLLCYKAADSFTSYEVFDYSTDPPTWLFAKSLSGYSGGHSGGDNQEARAELVLTLRDSIGKLLKLILLGVVDGRPGKYTNPSGQFFATLVSDLLTDDLSTSGSYVVGRSAHRPIAFVSGCTSSNNAIERKLVFG